MWFSSRDMTQEEVARGRASGGAAAHDRRRWLPVQDMLETMDPEEHYQQGVHISERIYGRQDIGRRGDSHECVNHVR